MPHYPPVPGPGETPLRPPDDLRDIADQARVLRDLLRRGGALDDARRLSKLIEQLEPLVIDVAILVGTYYFATKLRAGRLLFQWGWSAAGPMFARKLARLERLLPRVERAIGKLVNEVRVIKSRHPRLAGSGLGWEVLDQIVDGSVPAQLDGFACGPACVQMVLDDRGIHVPQAKIIEQARTMHHPELKSKMTRPRELGALLRRYDPNGGWTDDWDPKSLQARTDLQILSALGRRGSFIAQVGKHFVVVDGVDAAGHVLVRDPWYEPGLRRGIRAGSRYRLALAVFVKLFSDAVYRR